VIDKEKTYAFKKTKEDRENQRQANDTWTAKLLLFNDTVDSEVGNVTHMASSTKESNPITDDS
jgi:hypothetical protein